MGARALEIRRGAEVHAEASTSLLEELVPNSVIGAFARGNLLQVLLFSVLFGIALSIMARRGRFLSKVIEQCGDALMRIVEMIMRLAPLGAFGAMAFTVGKYGIATPRKRKLELTVSLRCESSGQGSMFPRRCR